MSSLLDLTCELNRLGQMNQSNVIPDAQAVVVLVSEDLIGGDLQSSILHSLSVRERGFIKYILTLNMISIYYYHYNEQT